MHPGSHARRAVPGHAVAGAGRLRAFELTGRKKPARGGRGRPHAGFGFAQRISSRIELRRRTKWIAACAPLAFVVVFAGYNTLAVWLYADEYYETPSSTAIVLGAGSASGKLSAVFVERINHALTLFNKGAVDSVIFTGGFGEGQRISDSQAARDFAVMKGLPADKAFIEEASTITYENLEEAKALMDAKGMESALIVSDPLHMRRAMTICKQIGLNAKPSPTPTTMYRSWRTKLKLLMYEAFFYNATLLVGRFNN